MHADNITTFQFFSIAFNTIVLGLIGVIMYWIKRYISNSDRKFDILFDKIDKMTDNFNKQDKYVALFQNELRDIKDRVHEIETDIRGKNKEFLSLKERIDKCRYCNSVSNNNTNI